jgi:bacillithiol system protein YtxJ
MDHPGAGGAASRLDQTMSGLAPPKDPSIRRFASRSTDPTMTVHPFESDSLAEWLREHAAGSYLIYKHSPRCGSSLLAAQEVGLLAQDRPEVEVFEIDVIRQRETSRAVAELLGIRHQSPQVILVAEGRAVWHASGADVRYDRIKAAMDQR